MAAKDIFESGQVALGCNYWASNAGIYMWRKFDLEAIRRDFAALSANGLTVLRVFPLWNDFQPIKKLCGVQCTDREIRMKDDLPLEGSYEQQAGLDMEMLEHFQQVMDLASEYKFKVIVALLTGWMSGRMFVPEALNNCNLITDPLAVAWELRFIKAFVRHFKGHPAIKVWEPGNECNCLSPVPDADSAYCWLSTITDAIRSVDPERPVWGGMHGLSSSFRGIWQIAHQGEVCDVLTPHPYPCNFTPHAELDRVDTIRNAFHGVAEANLYRDCSGREASIEEAGSLGKMFSAPEVASGYVNNVLWNALAHNIKSFLWWCSCDFTHLDYPPYDWNAMERELGLLDANGHAVPQLLAMNDFNRKVNGLNLKDLPAFRRDAVILLTDETDHWGIAWTSWLLAKQAGFDVTMQSAETPLKKSNFYILPAVTSTAAIPRRHYRELVKAVADGAVVLVTFAGGALEPFEEVFGVRVLRRYHSTTPCRIKWQNCEFTLPQPLRVELEAVSAEVEAYDEQGNIFLTCNNFGRGKAIFAALAPEDFMKHTPGVFADEADPWYQLYKFAAKCAGINRLVQSNDPQITLTEHCCSEKEVISVAVNNTPAARPFDPQIAAGWQVEYLFGKAGAIAGNSGVILRLTR